MKNALDQARIDSVQCISPSGLHRMVYKEWGDVNNPNVILCVHGVTRVSDDFDDIARALASHYRVICPDVVGRGRSDWLRNPLHYQLPQYVSDMITLLARINVPTVDFLGTSMGGLIGIGLASMPGNPLKKLILNDVGPVLNPEALARIGDYIGKEMRFASEEEGAAYIRSISLPFGPHTEEQWHKLSADVLRQDKDGMWIRHYDLGLARSIQAMTPEVAQAGEAMLWAAYSAITSPTLLLRGKDSDLLSVETAQRMARCGPCASIVEFDGVGHAPTLVQHDQIAAVRAFLMS